MDNNLYEDLYKLLGIKVEQLDDSYNPEEYGKRLVQQQDVNLNVFYSASTAGNKEIGVNPNF